MHQTFLYGNKALMYASLFDQLAPPPAICQTTYLSLFIIWLDQRMTRNNFDYTDRWADRVLNKK